MAVIASIRDREKADELHGVKLMKSRRGLELAAEILEVARRNGGAPRSLVAFKKHSLARRIVEIFLDPFSNPGAHWLASGAVQARKDVADLLWRIAPEEVRRFAGVFREPDLDAWSRTAVALADTAERAQPLPSDALIISQLATAFRAAAEATVMTEIIHGEHIGAAGTGGGRRYEAMSLNFPTFLEFIRQVDPILSSVRGICDVVHDNTPQFDTAFADGVDMFLRVGQIDHASEDGTPWRLSTGCIRAFRTADSKDVVGIQAADVLAACAARIARRSCDQAELDDREQVLAALGMSDDVVALMGGTGMMVPGIGGDDDVGRLHGSVLKAFDAVQARWPAPARNGRVPFRERWASWRV